MEHLMSSIIFKLLFFCHQPAKFDEIAFIASGHPISIRWVYSFLFVSGKFVFDHKINFNVSMLQKRSRATLSLSS